MEYNVGNVTIPSNIFFSFNIEFHFSFGLDRGGCIFFFFSSRFFHRSTFSIFENIKVVSFNETSSKYDRYLIAIFSSLFVVILIFCFFFLRFGLVASFRHTWNNIPFFEREEYFSARFSWTRLGCSCYRRDSFVRILFIVEIEIVWGRDWIEYRWKFCCTISIVFICVLLDGTKTLNNFDNVTLILFQFFLKIFK